MLGGALYEGNSELFSGPLGIVQIAYKGYDLGKTTADTTIAPDRDVKDINYQQDGSKPADHVTTGIEYILKCTFGEIKTGLLKLLMSGISSTEPTGADDGMVLGRSVFQSMLDNEAGVLKAAAVDENGIALEGLEHIFNAYKVIPIITGDLINWGVDTQRNLPVDFRLKYYAFPTPPGSIKGAFGYIGDPTVESVDAVVWPDVEAPEIVSAIASSADLLTVAFDENIDFFEDGAFNAAHYFMKINGDFVAPATGVITDADLALTFTGPFTNGNDVIYLSIAEDEIEDEATPPENVFPGVDAYSCTPWAGV